MSDPAPVPAAAERNLLYGILALQMDFISRDALIAAMHAGVLDKSKPLGAILQEQGALTAEDHAALELLVRQHLRRHGDDPQRSLAAVPVPAELHGILDPDVQASLSGAAPPADTDLEPTGPYVPRPADGLRYQVLRPHAKGGLGEVFVAEDTELHRQVALKEIQKEYAGDPHSRGRFLLEAEITGGLEHPGIVPVYGLGCYPDGRPFYAMRFIKGDSLKEAIQRFHAADQPARDPSERSLAFRELLGRFVDVCQAVAYAHSRGVLHRDLKPGNVMLGKYGETLLVDWGLAKPVGRPEALDGGDEETLRPRSGSGVAATHAGTALGTPAYMSPEQAAGRLDLLGPASDIYGLGATLYALLTGQAPFTGSDKGEVLRQVQRGEVVPPRKLMPTTPAALEAVCLKAMALRPEDRYTTALDLAADLQHWLADEPVRAYREPWAARAGRWMRRHKPAVAAAAAAVVVLLVLGGAGALWLERQEAERQAELARQEGALRQEVAAALDQAARFRQGGHFDESRQLLERARRRLAADGPDDLRRQVEQALADTALARRLDDARQRGSTVVERKWDYAGAERGYAAALREAGLVREGEDAGQAGARLRASAVREEVVAALDDWAGLTGNQARRAWLLAVARAADPDPDRDRLRRPGLWRDRAALAGLAEGGLAEALSPQLMAALARALAISGGDAVPLLREAQARHPDDFYLNLRLGADLARANRLEEAIGYSRAALALRPGSAAAHIGLAFALRANGRVEEAIHHSQQALRLDPKLAPAHYNLGNMLHGKGQVEGAIGHFQQALRLDPKFALAHVGLGAILCDAKRDYDGAVACFRRAIELDPKDAVAHHNLGVALEKKGEVAEAIGYLQQAVRLDPKHALAHCNLGLALLKQGRVAEALSYLKRGHELGAKRPGWRFPSAQWVSDAERLARLDRQLPAILRGEARPADATEQQGFARLCMLKKQYAAAARLYADAFKAKPKLADDLQSGHRYNAACAATLAAAGKGEDAAKRPEGERAKLRQQALTWLKGDLAAWTNLAEKGPPQARTAVKQKLRHWQQDPDLAGVRGDALAQLPAAEQDAWRKLWADVDALGKRVQNPK
jgi:tetratricopeptide (TPR) repeat protein/tRNA A-37 threonylcarbamoyl transferase component Bud32